MKTINMTFKIDDNEVLNFESWIRNNLQVISFRILPDTEKLYENDDVFKKMVKQVKIAQEVRDIYINEYNI